MIKGVAVGVMLIFDGSEVRNKNSNKSALVRFIDRWGGFLVTVKLAELTATVDGTDQAPK